MNLQVIFFLIVLMAAFSLIARDTLNAIELAPSLRMLFLPAFLVVAVASAALAKTRPATRNIWWVETLAVLIATCSACTLLFAPSNLLNLHAWRLCFVCLGLVFLASLSRRIWPAKFDKAVSHREETKVSDPFE